MWTKVLSKFSNYFPKGRVKATISIRHQVTASVCNSPHSNLFPQSEACQRRKSFSVCCYCCSCRWMLNVIVAQCVCRLLWTCVLWILKNIVPSRKGRFVSVRKLIVWKSLGAKFDYNWSSGKRTPPPHTHISSVYCFKEVRWEIGSQLSQRWVCVPEFVCWRHVENPRGARVKGGKRKIVPIRAGAGIWALAAAACIFISFSGSLEGADARAKWNSVNIY